MSDPTGAVPVEGTPAPESTPSSVDLSPLQDRMDELAGQMGPVLEYVQSQRQAVEPAAQETNWWDQITADPNQPDPNQGVDQYGNPVQPQPATPAFNQDALQQAVNQAISQANAPLLKRIQSFELERATQQLYQQIPQLADKPENAEVRAQTAQLLQSSVAQYPQHVAQVLINDPAYVAAIFKAAEAEKLAQGQAPAGEHAPTLEAAGGAHPGGGSEQNPIHEIFASSGGALPKGFR